MVVDQKVIEAEYFFDKIKNAVKREDLIPNLSAFLSSARSIADYLLEDYNLKFGLQISLNNKLYPRTFEEKARQKSNNIALTFISHYNKEFEKVKQDQIGGLLLNKRNIKVHRTDVPLQANFSVQLTETIHIHDSVAVEVRDKNGNLKMRSSSRDEKATNSNDKNREEKSKNTNDISTTIRWFFDDYQTTNVVDVCEKFLKLMKDFVEKIKNKYQ
jgi:hypothetical protein